VCVWGGGTPILDILPGVSLSAKFFQLIIFLKCIIMTLYIDEYYIAVLETYTSNYY